MSLECLIGYSSARNIDVGRGAVVYRVTRAEAQGRPIASLTSLTSLASPKY